MFRAADHTERLLQQSGYHWWVLLFPALLADLTPSCNIQQYFHPVHKDRFGVNQEIVIGGCPGMPFLPNSALCSKNYP